MSSSNIKTLQAGKKKITIERDQFLYRIKSLLLGKAAVPEARQNPSRKPQETVRVF